MKRFTSIFLIILICFGALISNVQIASAFSLGEKSVSKKGQKNGALIYSYAVSNHKLGVDSAKALVVNSYREHSCDITEADGGYGAFQWINGRKTNCKKWISEHYPKANDSDAEMLEAQVAFAVEEAKGTDWKTYKTGNMDTTEHTVWRAKSGVKSKGWAEFKKYNKADELANAWLNAWERSSDRESDATKNEQILELMEKCMKWDASAGGSGVSYSLSDVLWIGDSRTVGIYNAKGKSYEYGGVIAQISGNTATLKSIVEGKFNPSDIKSQEKNFKAEGSLVDKKQIKKGTKVILSWFGINQISDWGGTKAQYDALIKEGYIVLCPTVAGVNEKKYKGGVTNNQVETFNKNLKEWCDSTNNAYYLDISSSSYINDTSKIDADGLHYSAKNYKQVYKVIKSATNKTLNTISDAAAKEKEKEKEVAKQGVKISGQVYDESYFLTTGLDLKDSPLLMPDKDMMTVNEQTQVARWAENIDNQKITGISWLRTLIAFLGIMITIYSLLIYLAYWLDRVNNIIPFYVLPTITFGQLSISPDDTSTFNPEVQGKKVVIHKDVIKIVIIGCTLGVLLMTGQMYNMVDFVWRKISSFFGG